MPGTGESTPVYTRERRGADGRVLSVTHDLPDDAVREPHAEVETVSVENLEFDDITPNHRRFENAAEAWMRLQQAGDHAEDVARKAHDPEGPHERMRD